MFNKNTVLAMLLLTAASMGGTAYVEGADTAWTSTRLARTRKLKKADSGGGGGGTSANTAPRFLFLQPGINCRITQQAVTGIYLLSATAGNTTTAFTERPDRMALTGATQVFVNGFEDIFATSNPNAAVTFTTTTAAAATASTGPLIVEVSQPTFNNSSNYIEYPITQSKSQSEVAPMDEFLEMSDGISCSIFFDSGTIALYDSQTDFCFKNVAVDQYCWYPTDHFPNCFWTGVDTQGDNDCGPKCVPEPAADIGNENSNTQNYDDTHTRQWCCPSF